MHDVVGVVMVAIGDENFRAKDLVGAIRLRFSTGAHQRQVRARLRFGKVHRAGPLATNQLGNIGLFLCVRACGQYRFNRAIGEQWAQTERGVRAVNHLIAHGGNQFGQVLSADLLRMRQPLPTTLHVLLKRGFKTWRGCDFAIFEVRRLLVTDFIGRCDDVLIEFGRFVQYTCDGVHVQVEV